MNCRFPVFGSRRGAEDAEEIAAPQEHIPLKAGLSAENEAIEGLALGTISPRPLRLCANQFQRQRHTIVHM